MSLKPMLASPADLKLVQYPLAASPKLDGIRALHLGDRVVSRKLINIPNKFVQSQLANADFRGLDGELIVGPATAEDVYRKSNSGVMSHDGEPDFKLYLFDDFTHPDAGWTYRFNPLVTSVAQHDRISVLSHQIIRNEDDLLEYEQAQTSAGYEGVMLRKLDGKYKFGRSTAREGFLLKLKRFEDSEARVIGVEEEMFNGNEAEKDNLGRTKRSSHKAGKLGKGRAGALIVEDVHTGVQFKVGTGLDDTTKAEWWAWWMSPGTDERIVKYKFFAVGVKDKPRHPVYLGLRDKRDM